MSSFGPRRDVADARAPARPGSARSGPAGRPRSRLCSETSSQGCAIAVLVGWLLSATRLDQTFIFVVRDLPSFQLSSGIFGLRLWPWPFLRRRTALPCVPGGVPSVGQRATCARDPLQSIERMRLRSASAGSSDGMARIARSSSSADRRNCSLQQFLQLPVADPLVRAVAICGSFPSRRSHAHRRSARAGGIDQCARSAASAIRPTSNRVSNSARRRARSPRAAGRARCRGAWPAGRRQARPAPAAPASRRWSGTLLGHQVPRFAVGFQAGGDPGRRRLFDRSARGLSGETG